MTQHGPPRFRQEISILERDVQERPDTVNALRTHLLDRVEQGKFGQAVHEGLPRDAALPFPSRPPGAEPPETNAEAAALNAESDHLVFNGVLLLGDAVHPLRVVNVLEHLFRCRYDYNESARNSTRFLLHVVVA